MSPFDEHHDRRNYSRVPAKCPAKLRVCLTGEIFEACCFNFSVSGLALLSQYVPREDEELDICVQPPAIAGRTVELLTVRTKVKRCESLGKYDMYELGLEICQVLSPTEAF